MKIYVIIGESGEYSDHCTWLVKAFDSKDKALLFIEMVNAEHKNIISDIISGKLNKEDAKNKYDLSIHYFNYYDPLIYDYVEIELD